MAQLALGLAGAAIGSFFGMPALGFAIGSAIGGVVFKPPAPDGPRVSDKKLQTSQYGTMLPLIWGTERLAGTVIDQTDLVEHEHESDGKGSTSSSTFTYTASFDVSICDVELAGLTRIWADGRIVYDTTGATEVDNSKIPITLYLGTEDQLPDPTFEAIHGVGNISAYRGVAHAVFTDMELADFYNRIPNFEFEVYTKAGTVPTRISTWEPPVDLVGASTAGYQVNGASATGGVITIGSYEEDGSVSFPAGTWHYTERTFDNDGNELTSDAPLAVPQIPDNGFGNNVQGMIPAANAQIAFGMLAFQGANNTLAGAWYARDSMVAYPANNISSTPRSHDCVTTGALPYLYNENLYVCGSVGSSTSSSHIARYPAPSGIPSGSPDVFYTLTDAGGWQVTAGDDGFIYAMGPSGSGTRYLIKLDADLNLIHAWTHAQMPATLPQANDQFAVHGGKLFYIGANVAYAYTINGDFSFTLAGSIPTTALAAPKNVFPIVAIGGCLGLAEDGLISLCGLPGPVTLAEIVGDLCERGQLDDSQYDVSELTDLVAGYKLTQQTTLRTAVESLQQGYFFDALERDVLVAFPKRGKAPVVTIPADDLAAAEYGSEQGPIRDYTHGHDDDLPRRLWVVYQEQAADYQPGSQSAQRQTGNAIAEMSIELAVVMGATQARNIAETNLLQAHVERDKYSAATTRKYLYLEPTDVVGLVDRAVRLTTKEHTPSGLLRWDGVRSIAPIYVGTGTGSAGEGFSQPAAKPSQLTDLLLLDIPLMASTDAPYGFYAAMAGRDSTTWRGATLLKSTDGGATYSSVLTSTNADTFGITTDTLGDFFGGNTFDELNGVTVIVTAGSGTLSSATELAVLNGANVALVGSEVIQYKRAELIAARTYRLTGLLRGRKGTEWAMGSHGTADVFCVLPTKSNPPGPLEELFIARDYIAVTSGDPITTSTPTPVFGGVCPAFHSTRVHAFDWSVPGNMLVDTVDLGGLGGNGILVTSFTTPASIGDGIMNIGVAEFPGDQTNRVQRTIAVSLNSPACDLSYAAGFGTQTRNGTGSFIFSGLLASRLYYVCVANRIDGIDTAPGGGAEFRLEMQKPAGT